MKQSITIALILGLVVGATASMEAASTNPRSVDTSPVSKRITKYCDPVCELQAQDSAFALLIEAYRQFQARQIQIDYESRLRAAAALGQEADSLVIDTTLHSTHTIRSWIEVLAGKERDLRLEQLQTRVVNFSTVYQCARKSDEAAIDRPVVNKVNRPAAAQQLTTWRMLALGSPTRADFQTVTSTPAAQVFLDTPPADVWQEEIVGPCDDGPKPSQ